MCFYTHNQRFYGGIDWHAIRRKGGVAQLVLVNKRVAHFISLKDLRNFSESSDATNSFVPRTIT